MTEAIPDFLTIHATQNPEKPAVIDERPDGAVMSWSFDELNRQACRLGNAMIDRGLRPGDKVIWCGMNSIGLVRMMHAARKVGAVAVPLNYRLAPEEAIYIVNNSDGVLVYADADYADLFRKIGSGLPKVHTVLIFGGRPERGQEDAELLAAAASEAEPDVEKSETSDATMIYTSGTTGRPKGALRRHGTDPEDLAQLVAFIGYVPEDIYLTTGPLYHSGPGGFMGIAHVMGNTVVLQRKFDAEDWLRLVEKYRVTTTFSAPTPIRLVCQLPGQTKNRYDRSSMKRMIANAAPWSQALKEMYLKDFPADSLWEVYGSTELGVDTILRPEDQLRKPGSCGKAAPNLEVALFDEQGELIQEPHVPGELFVRSRSAFNTYYKAEDQFEGNRRGDWLTVGDIAYRDEEGYYFICDRKGDMIISGGMNIYPAEIEAALDRHPEILDEAVIGIPDEQWGESVHAVVVRASHSLTEEAVVSHLRQLLAGYKIPRSVSFCDEIPRNASGKILKAQLREPFWKDHGRRVG